MRIKILLLWPSNSTFKYPYYSFINNSLKMYNTPKSILWDEKIERRKYKIDRRQVWNWKLEYILPNERLQSLDNGFELMKYKSAVLHLNHVTMQTKSRDDTSLILWCKVNLFLYLWRTTILYSSLNSNTVLITVEARMHRWAAWLKDPSVT